MAVVSEVGPEGTQTQEAQTLSKQEFMDAYVVYELGGEDGLPKFVDALMKLCHDVGEEGAFKLINDTMTNLNLPPYRMTHLMDKLRKIVDAADQEGFTEEQKNFAKAVLSSYDKLSNERKQGEMVIRVSKSPEEAEPEDVPNRVAAYIDNENVSDEEIAEALFPKWGRMPADGQIKASLVEQSAIAALQRLKNLKVIKMDDEEYEKLKEKYKATDYAGNYSRAEVMGIAVEIARMIRQHRKTVKETAEKASAN
jgi:uncharacterized protein YfkK (UPF0435 family)